ncbi:hypothetical protein KY308_01795 [Candidatus Woesearchaeota archaeon]|nr:hypothetical protein [Candidatus Woesearchaeota archaeon]
MRRLLLIFLILLIIPIAHSVGVSPAEAKYIFTPNMNGEVGFTFRNNLDRNITIMPLLRGELKDYAHYVDASPLKLAVGTSGSVKVVYNLPESIGEPGWHSIGVVAAEVEGTGGTVGARGEVVVFIKFFVQYPGKYLSAILDAQDAKKDEDVNLYVYLSNLGTEDVSAANATIEIYDSGGKIGQVYTNTLPVKVQENAKLEAKWSSAGHSSGVYDAKAIVKYDEKTVESNDSFRIGTFHVSIINFSDKAVSKKINPFDITVRSEWNDDIENIFANVYVLDKGSKISTFSVASPVLKAWETKKINGYFDAQDIAPGTYNVEIEMSYSSKGSDKSESTKAKGTIEVLEGGEIIAEEPKAPSQPPAAKASFLTTTNLLIILIVILVLFNLIMLVKRRRKNEGEKGNKEESNDL